MPGLAWNLVLRLIWVGAVVALTLACGGQGTTSTSSPSPLVTDVPTSRPAPTTTRAPAPTSTQTRATSPAPSLSPTPTPTQALTNTPIPTEYYISPGGDDSSPGTAARPFRTIQAGQAAVRSALRSGVKADLTVIVRGGKYFLSAPLAFDDRDSPPDGLKVVYRNYQGEEPILVGGCPVTGWERVSDNIFRARVGNDWKFYTLFENGVRATSARTPNAGYAKVAAAVPAANKTQFVYSPADIPGDLLSADLRVYIWSGHNWWPDIVPVASIDRLAGKITLSDTTSYPIMAGDRYFIQGSKDLIDRPGEFALSEGDGYLYYWPRSVPIERQEIVAPATPRIIEVKGRSLTTPAHNLVFQGLTLEVTHFAQKAIGAAPLPLNGAIVVENADRITVQFCKVRNTGGHGIVLRNHAQENIVYGNLLEDLGIHGVLLQGPQVGQTHENKNNRISNNRVRRGGQLHGSGSGVLVVGSGDNEISHNKISDMPRYGISLKGITYGTMAPSYRGIPVTWDNHWDFINTRNNLVQFNDISRVLTDSEDAGGIEAWGAGKGNVIDSNRVHDFTAGAARRDQNGRDVFGLTKGIYLDDASDHNRITNNIIYGIKGDSVSPLTMKGIYNEFANNIVVDEAAPPAAQGAFGSHILSVAFAGERNDHLRIVRNIFVSTQVSDPSSTVSFSPQIRVLGGPDMNFRGKTGDVVPKELPKRY